MSTAPRIARGSAPGKVILLGEHAVVYGRPAIAAAIDRHVRVTLYERSGPARAGRMPALGPGEESAGHAPAAAALSGVELPLIADATVARVVVRAAELFGMDPDAFTATVSTTLPVGVGLGSSAALSVALVRALAEWTGATLTAAGVCARAFELERIFHGFPSGIDNTVATHGGAVLFRRGWPPDTLETPVSLPLVIALGRAPRQTRQTVSRLRQAWEADPAPYERLFDEIAGLVDAATEALAAGDHPRLGALMDANHACLAALGVSTPELDEMVRRARHAGALGAKLTGGGGGGAVICLCPDPRDAVLETFARGGWHAFAADLAITTHRGIHDRDRTHAHIVRP